jgi:transcription initiation factor TFIIIB Brf1 subunit/transcription initiation factor TFIIB
MSYNDDMTNLYDINNMMKMKTNDLELLMSTIILINNDIEQNNSCFSCGHQNFYEDYSKGIIVCHCGQVIDEIQDNCFVRKHYDIDDNNRNGIIYNKLLPQSSLGTRIATKGKIRKLHIWNSMPYKDRSLIGIFTQIHIACNKNNISRKIEDDTKIICHRVNNMVHKEGKNEGKIVITRGDNRKGIIAAAHFIACRRNCDTRSIKEIAGYWGIHDKDVNKGLKSLLNILGDDDIIKDTGTSKITDFVRRKCDQLEIKKSNTDIAIKIAENIEKLNIASHHTTYSLAAASIFLMAEITGMVGITKKKLSKIFEVSDVTIGKAYQQIADKKSILIDSNKVHEIMETINTERKKMIIPKAVWEQMIRFNIDTSKYVLDPNTTDLNSK